MRITKRQLQTIIREELVRSMSPGAKNLNELFNVPSAKALSIGAASGIKPSAIERLLPLFKPDATDEEAVEAAKLAIKVDYENDIEQMLSDINGAIGRLDTVAPVIKPFVKKDATLRLSPVNKALGAVSNVSGKSTSHIRQAVIDLARRLTGKNPV